MRRPILCLAVLAGCVAISGCSPVKPFNPAFDVAVAFTPAATAAMTAADAKAVVDVLYTGQPTQAAKAYANEAGLIEMGEGFATVDATSQAVHIDGKGFTPNELDAIQDQKVTVNIRVYSDNSHVETLITCTDATVALAAAQAKPEPIACDVAAKDR